MFIMAVTALRIELTIYWPLRERYSSGYRASTDINITSITHYSHQLYILRSRAESNQLFAPLSQHQLKDKNIFQQTIFI